VSGSGYREKIHGSIRPISLIVYCSRSDPIQLQYMPILCILIGITDDTDSSLARSRSALLHIG
jgi:hypothetical protein